MNLQTVKIGDTEHPIYFPYAALLELEEKFKIDMPDIMVKSASNFKTQFEIAKTGIKYGYIKDQRREQMPGFEDLKLELEPKHFLIISDVFIQSFPEAAPSNEVELETTEEEAAAEKK